MKGYKEFYKGKRVMVTGGLGFLGSNLAHQLLKLGSEVLIVDPMLELYGGNLFNIEEIKDDLKVDYSDIRERDSMDRLVPGQDLIFNLAAQVSHLDSMKDPFTDYEINVKGNLNVLEACRKFNPEVKLIYAGTRGQYGKVEELPVKEELKKNPLDIYSINKDAGESFHLLYNHLYGLRTTSLRINNTYGPRHQMKHNKYGILNWFVRLALDKETIKVYGDGSQIRDYNYVDDVTESFLLVGASDKANGESFNLGSGKRVKFIDLVKLIIKVAGTGQPEADPPLAERYKLIPWDKERKGIDVGDFLADYSKIEKLLGWSPKVNLEEGLKQTVDFYRKNKSYYW